MKFVGWKKWTVYLTVLLPVALQAQLEFRAEAVPQKMFGGATRPVRVVFRNSGSDRVASGVRLHLFQASSSTAAPVGEPRDWKQLQVLPGQTVLDSAMITLPAVKAETRFLVRWLDGTNAVLGTTEVLAYPPDLLDELKALAGEGQLGVLDMQDTLKPVLRSREIHFIDLTETQLDNYRGSLAIVGPFESSEQMPEGLAQRVETVARQGTAVVWLQPPPKPRQKLEPSFYAVPEGKGVVVVVQAGLVANLAENPQAQLNLVEFARLALHPDALRLPYLKAHP
jgi:hypothetical protein